MCDGGELIGGCGWEGDGGRRRVGGGEWEEAGGWFERTIHGFAVISWQIPTSKTVSATVL